MSKKEQIKTITPLSEVRGTLVKMEPEFKRALPSQIPSDRFTRVLDTILVNKPELLTCNRQSLYSSMMLAAQDGLLPDGREGAIIPFKGEAKWLPMVAGIIKKVHNSGQLSSLNPGIVYANDNFDYWIDENGPHMKHAPLISGDRGEMIYAYCTASTKTGGVFLEIMSREEIEKVRSMSKAKSGPWFDWPLEMAKKTVIRRLGKRLPVSSDIHRLFESDDDFYKLKEVKETVPEKTKSSRLSKVLEETEEKEEKSIIRKGDQGYESKSENQITKKKPSKDKDKIETELEEVKEEEDQGDFPGFDDPIDF